MKNVLIVVLLCSMLELCVGSVVMMSGVLSIVLLVYSDISVLRLWVMMVVC